MARSERPTPRRMAVLELPALPLSQPYTTRERLLIEAARLFRAHGYDGTSTRVLSETLGVTKPALYHHVRSKDALLLELCLESIARIDRAVLAAVAGREDALDRLRVAVVAHVVSALENADMHATMLIEMRALSAENHEVVRKARADYESLVRGLVEDAQRGGHLRADLEAKWMTLALLNTLNWSIFWYHPDGGLAPEGIGRVLLDVYLNGVADPAPVNETIGAGRTDVTGEPTQLDRLEAKVDALLVDAVARDGSVRRPTPT